MRIVAFFLSSALLAGCMGGPKPTGNETGGTIPWFATNAAEVHKAAEAHCAKFGKRSRIRDIRAEAGGHAFFDCI